MSSFESTLARMKDLYTYGKDLNENKNYSVHSLEYSANGADGKTYGIIRECNKYYIKTANKGKEHIAEGYNYIGGICNKKNYEYTSYSNALKNLELKLASLNEAFNGEVNISTLNPFKKGEFLVEGTEKMKNQIARQRQIMHNAAVLMNEGSDINVSRDNDVVMFNGKNPEAETGVKGDEHLKDTKANPEYNGSKTNGVKTKATPFDENAPKCEDQLKECDCNSDDCICGSKGLPKKPGVGVADTSHNNHPFNKSINEEELDTDLDSDEEELDAELDSDDEDFDFEGEEDFDSDEDFDVEGEEDFDFEGEEDFDFEGDEDFDAEGEEDFDFEGDEDLDFEDDEDFDFEGEEDLDFEDDEDFDFEGEEDLDFEDDEDFDVEGEEDFDVEGEEDFDVEGEEDFDVEGEEDFDVEGEEDFDVEGEDDKFVAECKRKKMKSIVETVTNSILKETELNVFGKHPGYRKKPMTLPPTGEDKNQWGEDWNDESVYSEEPFGSKIGDSTPFEKMVNEITNKVVNKITKATRKKKVK